MYNILSTNSIITVNTVYGRIYRTKRCNRKRKAAKKVINKKGFFSELLKKCCCHLKIKIILL